jgi:hypothetical protein
VADTAYIPLTGGAAAAALVQSRLYTPGPGAAVTQSLQFTSPTTAGNLLVCAIATRSFSGSMGGTGGVWTVLDQIDTNGFNSGDGVVIYKIADGTEGSTPFNVDTGAGTQRRIVLAEFSGPNTLVDSASVDGAAGTASLALGSVDPTSGASTLLLAVGVNASTITSIAGYTTISNGAVEGGVNGPRMIVAYKVVNPASGSYSATVTQDGSGAVCGGTHAAFSGSTGGVVWTPAPDTIDNNDASSDDVDDAAIIAAGDAFWRMTLDAPELIGELDGIVGFTDTGSVTMLLQAATLADYSDAATVATINLAATGSLTADDFTAAWDPTGAFQYWQLILDSAAQDVRVYEMFLDVSAEPPVIGPAKAILEIYVHAEDAPRWDIALWDEADWSEAGWQDVTPQGVNAHIIWGSRQPDRGILAQQNAASWNVETYDPDRVLDPGNADSPFYPQIVAGVPIRIAHDAHVIRTGYVDRISYKHKGPDYRGQLLCTDTIALLAQAQVPSDSILGDTLLERIQDAINATGMNVGGIPLPPGGAAGPAIAPLDTLNPRERSVWDHIVQATSEVLWVAYVDAAAGIGLRSWGAPLDRGREINAPNLEDLEAISSEDGLYSVARVQGDDPDIDPIEREAAPLPRYGRRVIERTELTLDPESWADAVLAERVWPGVRYVPGTVHCFTRADVDYFGSIEIMERVSCTVPGVVSVTGRVLGAELFVEHKADDTRGAKWQFLFAVATDGSSEVGITTLVADGTGDTLLDDDTGTDYLEAD